MTDPTLPKMPEPAAWRFAGSYWTQRDSIPTALTPEPLYTADQLRAWAAACVEQEREADPIRAMLDEHAEQLEANEHAYFELAYTRQTGWMVWITDKPARGASTGARTPGACRTRREESDAA